MGTRAGFAASSVRDIWASFWPNTHQAPARQAVHRRPSITLRHPRRFNLLQPRRLPGPASPRVPRIAGLRNYF